MMMMPITLVVLTTQKAIPLTDSDSDPPLDMELGTHSDQDKEHDSNIDLSPVFRFRQH